MYGKLYRLGVQLLSGDYSDGCVRPPYLPLGTASDRYFYHAQLMRDISRQRPVASYPCQGILAVSIRLLTPEGTHTSHHHPSSKYTTHGLKPGVQVHVDDAVVLQLL